ncbi:alpha/beta hydrolase [Marivirga sp. S37H4]|uniref:Alpha/beta hydrolase n=1 Tax=Marivirga aurantiaca TaxID=2802615 RepID=A0A934WXN9_9BACT|nr:alpha/beta hydrolase [Marivirga aurantiaca]MBK6264750.1 alpha/beta hydrolase [Marivirga aurantiaca]
MKVNIPGLHNSDINHWQSHFERLMPDEFFRVNQENWDEPDCETWIDTIEKELSNFNHPDLILIGHSIGCIAILKWFEKYQHKIKGALLVAPSDSERKNYPKYINGFVPIPKNIQPFPTIVVASINDHVTELDRSKEFANNWGSKLVILENAGHIESKSGFGKWDVGLKLVKELEKNHIKR